MLLAIDVGNTHIKFAFFKGDQIGHTFRIVTSTPRTSDELGMVVLTLMEEQKIKISDLEGIVVSSVVPDLMHALKNALTRSIGIQPMIVGPGTRTGIRLVKTNPNEVGADRMADGVAALEMFGGPVIVCDYGTASKFDYFSGERVFESAITCPGILLSARALWGGTARLPEIEIKDPGTIMAKDTTTSLQAGILYGHIGETEYIIRKIKEESEETDIRVVATGGLARTIFPMTDCIDYFEPDLLMHGLRIIYERNK